MWHDLFTVFWMEIIVLRRAYRKPSSFISTGLYVLFFGVFPAVYLEGDFVTSPLTLVYLVLTPLVAGAGMATLAFAGEREAHTLETLFASSLDDLAILLGKIAANTVYAWLYLLLCVLAGWLTVILIIGRIVVYNLEILVDGLLMTAGWCLQGQGHLTGNNLYRQQATVVVKMNRLHILSAGGQHTIKTIDF